MPSANLHFLHRWTLILTKKWELRCPETHQRKHVKASALDPFDLSGHMGVSKDFQTKKSFWCVSISLAIIWNMMSPFFDEVPGSKSGLASHASKRKLITSKRVSKQTPTTWLCKEIIWLAMICKPLSLPSVPELSTFAGYDIVLYTRVVRLLHRPHAKGIFSQQLITSDLVTTELVRYARVVKSS